MLSGSDHLCINYYYVFQNQCFFDPFSGQSSSSFSHKSQCLLIRVDSFLSEIRQRVSNRNIIVDTLHHLRKDPSKFLELVGLLKGNDDSDEDSEDSEDDEQQLETNQFSKILQERFRELEAFDEEHRDLLSFLNVTSIMPNGT